MFALMHCPIKLNVNKEHFLNFTDFFPPLIRSLFFYLSVISVVCGLRIIIGFVSAVVVVAVC
jgi:hypothetical protein